MSLDHLERAARAAGYAAVLDEDDAPSAEERAAFKPAAVRFKTPDAPAPRKNTALALMSETPASAVRAAVTSGIGQAVRSVQTLVGTRGAHA